MVVRSRLQRVSGTKPKGILEQVTNGYTTEIPQFKLPSISDFPTLGESPKEKEKEKTL